MLQVITYIMMRAPNLKAVRLEGMTWAMKESYSQYIACKLHVGDDSSVIVLSRCWPRY